METRSTENLFGASAAYLVPVEQGTGGGVAHRGMSQRELPHHLVIQFSEPQTSWLCRDHLLQIQQWLQYLSYLPHRANAQ